MGTPEAADAHEGMADDWGALAADQVGYLGWVGAVPHDVMSRGASWCTIS